MGLIKILELDMTQNVRQYFTDPGKDYFYHDDLSDDCCEAPGIKVKGPQAVNRYHYPERCSNQITSDSVFLVREGQCLVIDRLDRIVDLCAESGGYLYDPGTPPSMILGDLDPEKIRDAIEKSGELLSYYDRVFYVNIKDVFSLKIKPTFPVKYEIIDERLITNKVVIPLYAAYKIGYRIENPVLFHRGPYVDKNKPFSFEAFCDRGTFYESTPSYMVTLARSQGISIDEMEARGHEILPAMQGSENNVTRDRWGLFQVDAAFEDVMITEGSRRKVEDAKRKWDEEWEQLQKSFVEEKYLSLLRKTVQELPPEKRQEMEDAGIKTMLKAEWKCVCGKIGNRSKFCPECGRERPLPERIVWRCPVCLAEGNIGKFCPRCGAVKPGC